MREVDVQRIDLLDRGQLRAFGGADQRTFGDQRAADATRDGGRHRGVAQVDAGRAHGSARHGHLRLRGFLRRHGGVVFLLADRVGGHQRAIARDHAAGVGKLRLRLRQLRLRALLAGLVRRRVDLIEQLASAHVRAFGEHALGQDAGGASAYLRDARGLQTAGQLGGQADGFGLRGDHAHFGRRRRGRAGRASPARFFLLAAGRKAEGDQDSCAQRQQMVGRKAANGAVFGHGSSRFGKRGMVAKPLRQGNVISGSSERAMLQEPRDKYCQQASRDAVALKRWRAFYIHS